MKCEKLAQNAEMAARELQLDFSLEKIGDMATLMEMILAFDLLQTPGLVINGQLRSSGNVPSVETIKKWLQND